jgi:diguanylate cyclase (GGDEF)-like protein
MGILTALGVVYYGAGKLGLALAFLHTNATPVSPAAGIAMAAVLIGGWSVWPAIFAGAFLVNLTTPANSAAALGIAVGNTAAALIGGELIQWLVGGREVFGRARRLVKYAVVALGVSAVGATTGSLTLELAGQAALRDLGSIWRTWWLGDATGLLIVTPMVLLWISNPRVAWNERQAGEAVAVLAGLILTGQIVFGDMSPWAAQKLPLEFLCVLPLLWAGFRFGPRETATCVFLLSAMAIRGTLSGLGPFIRETPNESLVLLQAFLGAVAILGLVVTAAISDHHHTARRLRRLSVSDPLTGLANHRRLVTVLQEEIERSGRTERPFALLFLDLDDLKIINDRYGHLVGSRALCRLADALRATCRSIDTVARYGGDEFAVVLPESGEGAAWEVVRRVGERLARDPELPTVRASMGVAVYPRDGHSAEALLGTADEVLYDMKRARPSPPFGTRAPDLDMPSPYLPG